MHIDTATNYVVHIVPSPWVGFIVSHRRRPSRQRAVRKLSNIIGNKRKKQETWKTGWMRCIEGGSWRR